MIKWSFLITDFNESIGEAIVKAGGFEKYLPPLKKHLNTNKEKNEIRNDSLAGKH